MSLSELTHLWIEQTLVPEAMRAVPDHTQVICGGSAASAQAVVAISQVRYDDAFFSNAPKLRFLSRAGIGLDNVDIPAATRRKILVCNAPDGPTESTAEHAVALMLALAKRLKPANTAMAEGRFGPREPLMGMELRGKVLGLIGLGRIGRRVAEICSKGLGMEVLGSDPGVASGQAAAMGVTMATVEEIFRRADVLSLHAPLTADTRGLVSRNRLGTMKTGSLLINVSRGGLVVEADLLAALDSGMLAGAGLDVFDPEPPLKDSPLRHHPNVIATPHVASVTVEGRRRTDVMAVEQVLAYFRGEKPANLVNPEAWNARA